MAPAQSPERAPGTWDEGGGWAGGSPSGADRSSGQNAGEAMADDTYEMRIDFGTGGVRAGAFDAAGEPRGFHAVEFETDHPRPGRAEQDPDEWWSALLGAGGGVVATSGVWRGRRAGAL